MSTAPATAPSTVPATTPAPLPPASSPSIEQLPANIPRLELDGSNWAIFVVRFRESMQVNHRWGYFDGKITCPEPADPSNVMEDKQKSIEKWDHKDLVTRYLLSQRLPDSTAVRMGAYPTAKARWDRVNDEFTAKSVYAQNDLESTFYDMRCAKGGDVHVFLTSLRYKREELSAAGVSISDKEYQRTVLKGILEELARFASGILSSACIFKVSTVDTETLIDHICEEADRLKNRRAKSQSKDPGVKSSATSDDALTATGSGGKKKRRKGDCHNCGKAGHWARDCRSPKKEKLAEDTAKAGKTDKAQKSETKPVGSANAVVTQDEAVEDECWAVEFSSGASDPGDDLIDESDWLCEVEEMAAAVITPVSDDRGEHVELYDLGATRHISPYKSDFASYTTLNPPVYLNTANQQQFPAIGTGTLTIHAPNGAASSTLTLHEVLHVLAVGYTLVSIGALDKRGYRTSIGGGTLELFSLRGERVARIPQTTRGLYRTNHVTITRGKTLDSAVMTTRAEMYH
jgi:hypothetical protein